MTEKMIFVSHTAAAGVRAVLGLILISRLLAGKRPGGKSILTVLAGAAITTGAALAGGMPDRYRMGGRRSGSSSARCAFRGRPPE